MAAERSPLLDRFLRLCIIEAPSGREAPMAEALRAELAAMGLEARGDGTAARTGGACDNLAVELLPAGEARRWVTLMAHMDAVPPGRAVDPYVHEGAVRTRGAILSADDRAGIAILLELLAAVRREPLCRLGLQALFTASEETGLGGAEVLDRSALRGEFGVVLDTGGPPGQVNTASPTALRFAVRFRGRSAHAGVEPEKGANALLMAARLVAALPSGRLDLDTTFSCTRASAGTATNIVPDDALVEGEVRSFREGEAGRLLALLKEEAESAARSLGGTVAVTVEALFPPYHVAEDHPAVAALLAAAEAEGWRGFAHRSGGGSDANHLNAAGLPAVNVGVGYRNPHSPEEILILDEFEGAYRWLLRFLRSLDG